jgi:hypothetical protein
MRLALLCVLLAAPALAEGPQLEALKAAPSWLTTKGTFTGGIRWHDNNGENVVVVSTRSEDASRFLRIQHVVRVDGGAPRELRQLSDTVQGCGEDIVLRLVERSLALTDLDHDGLDEASFSYLVGCRRDMSPVAMKLVLLENGDKYIMRGEQEMYVRKKDGSLELDNP